MNIDLTNKLMNTSSLDEFFAMFFGLSIKEKLSVIGDDVVLTKGTILYRARKDKATPLYKDTDWMMPPEECINKGRFNYEKKPVLYLSTMDFILPREIGLRLGDSYYLAKYRVKNDFRVSSLIKIDDKVNCVLHKVAIAIEDDKKLSEKERSFFNVNCNRLTPEDVISDFKSSFYLYHCMKKNLYDITNKIADLAIIKNFSGIRYCSCYIPIEISGGPQVLTLNGEMEGNYALTSEGTKNIELLDIEHKVYTEEDYKKNDLSLFINNICDLSE